MLEKLKFLKLPPPKCFSPFSPLKTDLSKFRIKGLFWALVQNRSPEFRHSVSICSSAGLSRKSFAFGGEGAFTKNRFLNDAFGTKVFICSVVLSVRWYVTTPGRVTSGYFYQPIIRRNVHTYALCRCVLNYFYFLFPIKFPLV